jgi:hypothetical protein
MQCATLPSDFVIGDRKIRLSRDDNKAERLTEKKDELRGTTQTGSGYLKRNLCSGASSKRDEIRNTGAGGLKSLRDGDPFLYWKTGAKAPA